MNRFIEAIKQSAVRLFNAVSRFPLTVICLISTTILICYMISLHKEPDIMIQKLMYTFLLGAFLSVTAQFLTERFERLQKMRLAVYIASALLVAGYYLILLPAPNISFQVSTRTFVAVFAMFCAFIWVPSCKGRGDFNSIALIHFKSAFISVLYSAVLSAGCASIIAAVDILLYKVDPDSYGYMMTTVWVLFATLYYLSLLPRFNSDDEIDREFYLHSAQYPRFLEILVSYIAVPLVAAYTLVLTAYFIKIAVTMKWPSGQLGGMVLAYAAAGLIILILASLPDNRFAVVYRSIFPKVLIPIVIMQLISVGIRVNAYGITESRYYIVLFGIFAIICGIILSVWPVTRNGFIAVLAALFAIFSVLPPVDAFTVSRNSQITRLENMLSAEGLLQNGAITPKSDVTTNLKLETTSILNYLYQRGYIKYVAWLPADFKPYEQTKQVLGFEQAYAGNERDDFFYANLDMSQPINIEDYDILLSTQAYRGMQKTDQQDIVFTVRDVQYKLVRERLSPQEVKLSVKNTDGVELVGTGLNDFVQTMAGISNRPKEQLPVASMSFDVENNGYHMQVIFRNVNITRTGADAGADYDVFVLFGAPRTTP